MNNDIYVVRKMTMTISIPLELYVWLKRTQRNCSAFVVQAIEAQKQEDTGDV